VTWAGSFFLRFFFGRRRVASQDTPDRKNQRRRKKCGSGSRPMLSSRRSSGCAAFRGHEKNPKILWTRQGLEENPRGAGGEARSARFAAL